MLDTQITLVGNLTEDPEVRFTASGTSVTNVSVASTPRVFDKGTQEWSDAETLFMRLVIWGDMGKNTAESLHMGNRVIVQGNLVARSWEDRDGNNRTAYEVHVTEIGPTLRFHTAVPTKGATPEAKPAAKKTAARRR